MTRTVSHFILDPHSSTNNQIGLRVRRGHSPYVQQNGSVPLGARSLQESLPVHILDGKHKARQRLSIANGPCVWFRAGNCKRVMGKSRTTPFTFRKNVLHLPVMVKSLPGNEQVIDPAIPVRPGSNIPLFFHQKRPKKTFIIKDDVKCKRDSSIEDRYIRLIPSVSCVVFYLPLQQ